jgi:hypothetical protein
MPNWCNTYLTIRAPSAQMDALLAALEGPRDWAMPMIQSPLDMMRRIELSAHQQLALDGLMNGQDEVHKALRAQWVARLQAHKADTVMAPVWMPVSREDLRYFWYQENGLVPERHREQTVPLSLPKLAPWPDRALFDRHFPGGVDDEGFWAPNTDNERGYNSGSLGPIALRQELLGVKWPPGEIVRREPVADPDGTSRVLFTYQTPWAPIDDLGAILAATLTTHQAQALLFWQEEDQNSGWAYINPAESIDVASEWERESFIIEVPDPDYPGDTTWEWDSEAMALSAQEAAEAPFLPLVDA